MTRRLRTMLGRVLTASAVCLCSAPFGKLSAGSFENLGSAEPLLAQQISEPVAPADDASHTALIPQRLLWPGIVVIVVIAIFVTAAVAGPIIRANTQDEPPDSDSSKGQ